MDFGGAYVEAVDASDREGEISTKYTWRVGGDLPWGCDSTYMEICGGGGGPSKWDYDPDDWASSAYYGEQGFSEALSDFDDSDFYEGEGEEICQFPPDPSDECRAAVPLGVSFMDLTGNGAEEPLPCVGFVDVLEGERSDIYWGNADELYSIVSNSGWNIPNGVFGAEDPESRTTCGSWEWGLAAFAQLDVTGEGTRDILTSGTLPPELTQLGFGSGAVNGTYSAVSVEFGMVDAAPTGLYVDLLQRYARLDTRGNEELLEQGWAPGSNPVLDVLYSGLFTGETRGGPSGDLQADLNGDGLVDLVRLEPTAGFVNGSPGEIDAFIDSDPRLACKAGTAESELPARAAVYFNRGDGSFEQGPTRTGFEWQDYCRRFMQAAAAFDIDGDGRSEVVLPGSDGASFEVLELASDGGLELSSTTLTGPEVSWVRQAKTVFVADVSGSGQASLVVARPGPTEGVSTLYATSLDAPAELLASVTDGYGAQTFVEYGGAQDVFAAVDCSARPGELQSHTPRWPLVSAIVRPKAIGGGVQRNDVDLHRYRGWCNGPIAYGGGFEQHIETVVVDVGSGVEPGVYEGFGVPVASSTTTRDDYSDRMGTFRGNVTKREELRWFPEEGGFTYNRDEAVEREYSDGFLHEWGIDEFYENEVGVPLWHPVGVKGTRVSEASTFYTPGSCDLEGGLMECEASSVADLIHHSREERTLDEFGLVSVLEFDFRRVLQ